MHAPTCTPCVPTHDGHPADLCTCELPGGLALQDPSAAIALVWVRRSLAFQSALFDGLVANKATTLVAAAPKAAETPLVGGALAVTAVTEVAADALAALPVVVAAALPAPSPLAGRRGGKAAARKSSTGTIRFHHDFQSHPSVPVIASPPWPPPPPPPPLVLVVVSS